jgi:hypothetical protein
MGRKGQKLTKLQRYRISQGHIGIKYPNRSSPPKFTREHRDNIRKSIKNWWGKRKLIDSSLKVKEVDQ